MLLNLHRFFGTLRCHVTAIVVALVVLLMATFALYANEVPGISAGQIIVSGPPWPDSIGVPIMIAIDDTVKDFSIWIHPELAGVQYEGITPSSFAPNTILFKELPDGYWGPQTYLDPNNALGYHWTSVLPTGLAESPHGSFGTLYFRIDNPDIPFGTVIQLDTTNVAHVAPSEIEVIRGGENQIISVPFVLTPANIIFGAEADCGDADGSGEINVTDAVYLVNYIFGGGLAPAIWENGDVDCDGLVIISDAVYLINYIFAGGPIPCASCGL